MIKKIMYFVLFLILAIIIIDCTVLINSDNNTFDKDQQLDHKIDLSKKENKKDSIDNK